MHIGCLEQMMGDLHLIRDRPDDMRADMSPVIESFQPSPHPRPFILHEPGGIVLAAACPAPPAEIHGRGLGIDPLFDFDGAGAVVEFVGDVGGLGGDVADLANEGDLLDFDVVDFELGVGMRLGGVEDLFDGAGAEGVFRLADVSLVERRGGGFSTLSVGKEERRVGWEITLFGCEPPCDPDMKPPPPAPP